MTSNLPNRPPKFHDETGNQCTSKDLVVAGVVEEKYSYLITLPYNLYLETHHWATIRDNRKEKDNHKCTRCGATEGLHVHHRTYRRLAHEKLSDLRTLCHSCHERVHGGSLKRLS